MKGLKPFVLLLALFLTSCSLIGDLLFPDGFGVSEYTINCRDIYKVSGTSIGYDVSDRKYYLKPQFTNDKRFSLFLLHRAFRCHAPKGRRHGGQHGFCRLQKDKKHLRSEHRDLNRKLCVRHLRR